MFVKFVRRFVLKKSSRHQCAPTILLSQYFYLHVTFTTDTISKFYAIINDIRFKSTDAMMNYNQWNTCKPNLATESVLCSPRILEALDSNSIALWYGMESMDLNHLNQAAHWVTVIKRTYLKRRDGVKGCLDHPFSGSPPLKRKLFNVFI